jgi:hypothetical protein
MKSETEFEQVSCDEDAAEICTNFPDAEGGLWYQNGMITEKGTVYCVVSQ